MDDTLKLTTVKILKRLYADFKHKSLDNNFTLQKLVNRSMDVYLLDKEYKAQIHEHTNLTVSGSRL